MPIYDFKCKECSAVTESIVKMGTTESKCRICGCDSVKQFSANAVGFKVNGAGAYDSGKFKPK